MAMELRRWLDKHIPEPHSYIRRGWIILCDSDYQQGRDHGYDKQDRHRFPCSERFVHILPSIPSGWRAGPIHGYFDRQPYFLALELRRYDDKHDEKPQPRISYGGNLFCDIDGDQQLGLQEHN